MGYLRGLWDSTGGLLSWFCGECRFGMVVGCDHAAM